MKSNQVQPEYKERCADVSGAKTAGRGRCSSPREPLFKRICISGLLLFSIIVLSGTKACREDYDLGSQTTLVGTPTATPTVSATETEGGIKTFTSTPTATATSSGNPSPTAVFTPTPTPTPSATSATVASSGLSVRSMLGEVNSGETQRDVKARMNDVSSGAIQKDRNWLGRAYIDDGEASDSWVDSDDDGFSDELEARLAQEGLELILPESRLVDRVEVYDQDLDGFEDKRELEQGLSPNSSDTDADGFLDGLEVLAGSSPLDRSSRPKDVDNDGAPDVLEESLGMSLTSEDSDGDRLPDRVEIVLSSDGIAADTDGDGISDGKEVDLGSDPLISDFPDS